MTFNILVIFILISILQVYSWSGHNPEDSFKLGLTQLPGQVYPNIDGYFVAHARDNTRQRSYFGSTRALFRTQSALHNDIQNYTTSQTAPISHVIDCRYLLDMVGAPLTSIPATNERITSIILDEDSGIGYFSYTYLVFEFSLTDLLSDFTATAIIDIRNQGSILNEFLMQIHYDSISRRIFAISTVIQNFIGLKNYPYFYDVSTMTHSGSRIRSYRQDNAWQFSTMRNFAPQIITCSVIDVTARRLYIAGENSFVGHTDLDSSGIFIINSLNSVFDSNIYSMVMFEPLSDPGENHLYVLMETNTNDLVLDIKASTLTLITLYGVERGRLLIPDPDYDVLYITDFSSQPDNDFTAGVLRIDLRTGNIRETLSSTPKTYLPSVGYISGNQIVLGYQTAATIINSEWSGEVIIDSFTIATCSNSSAVTCNECYEDPYCGLCTSNTEYCLFESACTLYTDCPFNWNNILTCPDILLMNPQRGSTDGFTDVTFSSTIDLSNIDSIQCIWDGGVEITGAISQDNSQNVICTSPAGTGLVDLEVKVQNIDACGETFYHLSINDTFAANIYSYQYYDCSTAADCASCNAVGSDCGWCASENACMTAVTCTTGIIDECPLSLGIKSEYISIEEHVVLLIANVNPALTYRCNFAGGVDFQSTVTITQSTTDTGSIIPLLSDVQCDNLPDIDFDQVPRQVFVSLEVQNSVDAWVPYVDSDSSVLVTLYDSCTKVSSCGDCLDIPSCGFCSGSCQIDDGCSDDTCTEYVESINPSTVVLGVSTNIDVTLVGLVGTSGLFCNWNAQSETPVSTTGDTSVINCDAPSTKGTYSLRITDGTNFLTGPFSVIVHECEDFTTCDTCSDHNCNFCGSSTFAGTCSISCSSTVPGNDCMRVDVDDPSDDYQGGGTLSLTGQNFTATTSCYILNVITGTVTTSPVSLSSASVATCVAPSVTYPSPHSYVFGLSVSGVLVTQTVPFDYYDCNYFGSCMTCRDSDISFGYSKCGFCDGQCTSCSDPSECSVIIDDYYSLKNIYIEATKVDLDSLQCVFTSTSGTTSGTEYITPPPTSTITNSSLVCPIPLTLPSSGNIEYVLDVRTTYNVNYFDRGIVFNNTLCPNDASCLDSCYAAGCSWCLADNTCKRTSDCDGIYLEDSCPTADQVSPRFVEVPGDGNLFNITITTSGFDFSQTLPSAIRCNVEGIAYTAYIISSDTILCELPSREDQANVGIGIQHGSRVLSTTIRFFYLNCGSNSVCGDCVNDGVTGTFCGWCMSAEGTCSLPGDCLPEFTWSNNYTCPTLSQNDNVPVPTSGEFREINGQNFFDHPYKLVSINDLIFHSSVEYINETTMRIYIPNFDKTTDEVTFRLYFGKNVNTGIRSLPLQSQNLTILIVILAASIFIVFLVVGLILLRIFVFKKSKDPFAGLDVELIEPDYELLLFPQDKRKLVYTVPKDDFADFEQTLFSDDKHLFSAFVSVIGTEDQDKAATSFIYMSENLGVTLDFMLHIVQEEIDYTEQAETIFRGNSLASKMFKTYSRLIGLPYIFETIAYPVLELQALDIKKENVQGVKGIELNMIDFDLEVDETKIMAGEQIETNTINLKLVCEKIFQAIVASKKNIPPPFMNIFHFIKEGINEKFGDDHPDTNYHAVGGLLFLRFLIPAIFSPQSYGITEDLPAPTTQRKLILITKVIQSIANMALPGKKEPFMESMTDFIETKIPRIKTFYDEIMVKTPLEGDYSVVNINRGAKLNAIALLWNMFKHKSERIKSKLLENGHDASPVDHLLEKYSKFADKKK